MDEHVYSTVEVTSDLLSTVISLKKVTVVSKNARVYRLKRYLEDVKYL
jgi:hypothetical protein